MCVWTIFMGWYGPNGHREKSLVSSPGSAGPSFVSGMEGWEVWGMCLVEEKSRRAPSLTFSRCKMEGSR